MPCFLDNISSATSSLVLWRYTTVRTHIINHSCHTNKTKNKQKGKTSCWVQLHVRCSKKKLGYVWSLNQGTIHSMYVWVRRFLCLWRLTCFHAKVVNIRHSERRYPWPICYSKFPVTRRILSKCKPLALPFQIDGYGVTFTVFASLILRRF